MKKFSVAVIIYGPPGSGKGTQAQLLADKLDLIHFDSGRYLRELLYEQKNKKNKTIQKERKLNESGSLNTPSWVLKIVGEKINEIGGLLRKSVVLSGSPRTMFEAVGDKKQKGLIKKLENLYGKNNIFIFKINVSVEQTIKRNTHRLVCSVCGTPIMGQMLSGQCQLSNCPFCGGKLKQRFDDAKSVIMNRLKEYKERTEPIVAELKKRKYKVFEINGSPMPYKIHKTIIKTIEQFIRN